MNTTNIMSNQIREKVGRTMGAAIRKRRRYGNPRTDAERRRRHRELFGTSELLPRGFGLR